VNCDGIPTVSELVAEQVEERIVSELGLLQADHIRPPLIQPRQQPRHALLHRVDVPGRDSHRPHGIGTADGAPRQPGGRFDGSSNPSSPGSARTASPSHSSASGLPCLETTQTRPTIGRTKWDRPPQPRQTSARDDTSTSSERQPAVSVPDARIRSGSGSDIASGDRRTARCARCRGCRSGDDFAARPGLRTHEHRLVLQQAAILRARPKATCSPSTSSPST
jgi:hypothetical protein